MAGPASRNESHDAKQFQIVFGGRHFEAARIGADPQGLFGFGGQGDVAEGK